MEEDEDEEARKGRVLKLLPCISHQPKCLVDSVYALQSETGCSMPGWYMPVMLVTYEPRREKTGLRGFRPGPT